MSQHKTVAVDAECVECQSTGIYRGRAEPPGVGVICLRCKGTGKQVVTYAPFVERKVRDDIETVYRSRGDIIFIGVGPFGSPISYKEFLESE